MLQDFQIFLSLDKYFHNPILLLGDTISQIRNVEKRFLNDIFQRPLLDVNSAYFEQISPKGQTPDDLSDSSRM